MGNGGAIIGNLARNRVPATKTGVVTAASQDDHHGRDAQSDRNGCHFFKADLINRFIPLRIHLRNEVPASRDRIQAQGNVLRRDRARRQEISY